MAGEYSWINRGSSTKDSSQVTKREGKPLKYMPIVICIWVSSSITKNMVREPFIGLVSLRSNRKIPIVLSFIVVSGGVVFLMDQEFIPKSTVIYIQGHSRTDSSMGKGKKFIAMEIDIKVSTLMDCPKVMVSMIGETEVHIGEILNRVLGQAMVFGRQAEIA